MLCRTWRASGGVWRPPTSALNRAHSDHRGGGWNDTRHRRNSDQDAGWDVSCDVAGARRLIMSTLGSIHTVQGTQRWITRQRQDVRGNW